MVMRLLLKKVLLKINQIKFYFKYPIDAENKKKKISYNIFRTYNVLIIYLGYFWSKNYV